MRHSQQHINLKESKCHIYMSYIVRRSGRWGGGWGAGTNLRGPAMLHMFLSVLRCVIPVVLSQILQCKICKYIHILHCKFLSVSVVSLSIVGTNPLRPNLSHSVTENQSYCFSVRFLSCPPLLGGEGGGSKKFLPKPKPVLGGPA